MRLDAILQTSQLQVQFTRALGRQLVNHPLLMALSCYQTMFAQIGQVLGNGDLRRPENVLEMAHAEGALREQVQNAQPRFIAEALVNFQQLHSIPSIYL